MRTMIGFDTDVTPKGRWCVLAPLLEQKYQNRTSRTDTHTLKYGNFGTFERLAVLTLPESRGPQLGHFETAPLTKLSMLESLPDELLDMILCDTIFGAQDIVNLGVCSKRLWVTVLRHIRHDTKNSVAPWSGTPLICPFNGSTEFPPAMADLFPDIKARQDAYNIFMAEPHPVTLWFKQAEENFVQVEADAQRHRWLEAVTSPLITQDAPPQIYRALKSTLEDALRLEMPLSGEKWALRNLTINEYVRLEVADTSNEAVVAYVETARWLTLDMAFRILIFWIRPISSVGISETTLSELQKRGAWAAHCFDVVRCSEPLLTTAWKDVTERVVSQARQEPSHRLAEYAMAAIAARNSRK